MNTHFAPAERSPDDEIKSEVNYFLSVPNLKVFFDADQSIVVILNHNRQIVFGNKAFFETFNQTAPDKIYGQRTGEIFECEYALGSESGCGTTPFCKKCGAVKSILKGLQGVSNFEECSIIQKDGGAVELRVYSSPFEVNGKMYTFFSILDISQEKRRAALERIFFHDILNTAGGIKGFIELLQRQDIASMPKEEFDLYKNSLADLSKRLIDELYAQRDLAKSEHGDLEVKPKKVKSLSIVKSIIGSYLTHEVSKNKKIIMGDDSVDIEMLTDVTLLSRVLGNMLKNALEAAKENEEVTIGCIQEDNKVKFWVNNKQVMPEDVKLQIFKRSYSTKGVGRGLGTYSIKMLSEKYLHGKVSFKTNENEGTTFYAIYPININ